MASARAASIPPHNQTRHYPFDQACYGQCKAIVEAEDWEGPTLQTCMDAASVCRAFETTRRREALSFKHHREVAALPPTDADALLDWAEAPLCDGGKPRSTRELRGEVSNRGEYSATMPLVTHSAVRNT